MRIVRDTHPFGATRKNAPGVFLCVSSLIRPPAGLREKMFLTFFCQLWRETLFFYLFLGVFCGFFVSFALDNEQNKDKKRRERFPAYSVAEEHEQRQKTLTSPRPLYRHARSVPR